MIVYVFFVHKKSVSKRKVCIIFIKNEKFKKKPKNPFLVGFFRWVFWVGFLLPTLAEGQTLGHRPGGGGEQQPHHHQQGHSVADPGSGISGAFLTPGSGIRNRFFPDPGSRIPNQYF
jgi:hypothetical protein